MVFTVKDNVLVSIKVFEEDINKKGTINIEVPDSVDGETIEYISGRFSWYEERTNLIYKIRRLKLCCSKIKSIPNRFAGYMKLTAVDLSQCKSLTSIEEYAFYDNNINTVKLPPSIIKIKACAFYDNCIKALDISSCKKLQLIENYAFAHNNQLTSVIFPDSIEKLKEGIFARCCKLKSINFNNAPIISIPPRLCNDCTALEEVVFSPHTKEICSYAFNCCSLRDVEFCAAINRIKASAFAFNDLHSVSFANCLNLEISRNAFLGNPNIKDITLNSYCSGIISNKAFSKCSVKVSELISPFMNEKQ